MQNGENETQHPISEVLAELEGEIRARYSQRLARISHRFDVDDLVQSTSLKAVRAAGSCRAETVEELRGWVMATAKRAMLTAIAREIGAEKRSVLRESTEAELHAFDADGLMIDAQTASEEVESDLSRAERLLATLPPRQCEAIRLRYIEQLDSCSIAQKMNSTTLAAHSLASKGLARIRQLA